MVPPRFVVWRVGQVGVAGIALSGALPVVQPLAAHPAVGGRSRAVTILARLRASASDLAATFGHSSHGIDGQSGGIAAPRHPFSSRLPPELPFPLCPFSGRLPP